MRKSIPDLDLLDKGISELIKNCNRLKEENSRLRQAMANIETKCSQLQKNNELASEEVRQAIEKLQMIGA